MGISYGRAEYLSLDEPDPKECRECGSYDFDEDGDCIECEENLEEEE